MKALEIDESLPEAHVALASPCCMLDWDWAGAERGFKRAIELDPNSADAHRAYGGLPRCMGRLVKEGHGACEAGRGARPPVAAEPRLPRSAYYFDRQFDQALEP